jgi:high-affinity iron transporter
LNIRLLAAPVAVFAIALAPEVRAQSPAFAQTPTRTEIPPQVQESARRIAATLTLAAQEYALAFRGGRLVNQAEYDEAMLFVAEARRSARDLPVPLSTEMDRRLERLGARLAGQMPADSLAIEARLVEVRLVAALGVSLDDRPAREPSLASGAHLYRARCASCHAAAGRGDGAAAEGLTPPPANFTDTALLASATPLDLYRKITHGVPGTAMAPFGDALSREERWDVVAHVLTLADPTLAGGRSGQLAVVFGTVRGTLGVALELVMHGEHEAAARKVLDAYMAFEPIEGSLGATDPALVRRAEDRFLAMRTAAEARADGATMQRRHAELMAVLGDAAEAMTRDRSPAGLFVESLLLMLREGLEAILVIGAIMAVLLKAGATERQRDVRWGVAAALLASLGTAAALELVFRITPTQREALEGGVMLVAAAMLFYVSYWLISKVEIVAWTRFVKGHIQRAVQSGSGLALGGVAFLAVYREGFETILFYKALYLTGGTGGAAPITAGIVSGSIALAAVYIGIERFGLRIPMRPFFAVTGATLAYMAFVFAGNGVKELQEGGYVGNTIVPGGPTNDFLGIYPTWESLAVQGVILLAIVGGLAWTFVLAPWRSPATTATPVSPSASLIPPSVTAPSRSHRKAAGV